MCASDCDIRIVSVPIVALGVWIVGGFLCFFFFVAWNFLNWAYDQFPHRSTAGFSRLVANSVTG